jgi:hypothetical protein
LTGILNITDNFKAKTLKDTYLFFSLEFMICRETPTTFPKLSCVRSKITRCSFKVFFILFIPFSFQKHQLNNQHKEQNLKIIKILQFIILIK